MKLTIIQPAIGKRQNSSYVRSWEVESLTAATLAGMTPPSVSIRFWDDRLESIPYDEPTDLVALTVETYTAKRSYQIASEFRKRNVPVVMGGFHPTLCPDEVAHYAESVIVGEAENVWPRILDDFQHQHLEKFYKSDERSSLGRFMPNRTIFQGKRYLPLGLVETGRGCTQHCEFCAVQTAFHANQTSRPIDSIIQEIKEVKKYRNFFFLVNDNIAANVEHTKELCRALIPLNIRWVSQASLHIAFNEELLELLHQSGCRALLMGLESLNSKNLQRMNKNFNQMGGGYKTALTNLRRHGIRVYGTFIFGYDSDEPDDFEEAVDFAIQHSLYLAAFAHLMPFPGTPLYERLGKENRLLYDKWWLEESYRFNMVPFRPLNMTEDELHRRCLKSRKSFYRGSSILQRTLGEASRPDIFMFWNFFVMNLLHRKDVRSRDCFPLGDEAWQGSLLKTT